MSYGPPSKVLAEVHKTMKSAPAGDITLTWNTVHGHIVVEASAATFRVEPSSMPEQGPGGIVHKQPPADKPKSAVREAFEACWEAIRPQ